MMFYSVGTLKYSRKWCYIEVEHDIGRYFRNLLLLSTGLKLQRPSKKEHITIVSPHDSPLENKWRYKENAHVGFKLFSSLFTNGNAFWYEVLSCEALKVRFKLCLEKNPIPLHLCIGYLHGKGKRITQEKS